MKELFFVALAGSATLAGAADIVSGDVSAALGPDFFFDEASTGGSDNTVSNFNRDLSGLWTAGASVTLTGMGWASSGSGTVATEATVTFTDLGPDETLGTADDVVVGSVADGLVFNGAGEYLWQFDSPVSFVATGGSLRISIQSDGAIRRKTSPAGNTSQEAVKLTLAGTAVGGEEPPVNNTASASGYWDSIAWDTGTGTTSGDLEAGDSVLIGQYRTVTYRGIPAEEEVANLNLGQNGSNAGQGWLIVESGDLSVSGSLVAGRNASANDAFLEVRGGSLTVAGEGKFGASVEGCDGSLILSGGACSFGGDLTMGAFEMGGSMLRFHNVGSSSPLEVGGTLHLDRCALDLTFDEHYQHVAGTTFTLVQYSSRSGQFGNFREGDDFNCGPHRFRINYDIPSSGSSAITLTALEPWGTDGQAPNIIFMFSDDQGYSDLQLNGHPEWAEKYPMPALQQIATNGARFTDAYVTAGVCHPSRCGILSGIYQQRFGTDNNLSGPSYNGLSVAVRTVPRRLQSLGYRTYGVGKWHLGDTVEYHPNVRGFDQWYGMWSGSRSYYNSTSENQVFQDQMTPVFDEEDNTYLTDRIGDKTVEFIDEHLSNHAGQPFFIYMSFTAVHGPMDIQSADARFARLQNEFGLTAADYLDSPRVFAGSSQAAVDANRYELAAMTLALDENIKKVVDKIAEAELSEETILVYMTDNGGAEWSSGFGGNYSYNVPLKGKKGSGMQEGSVRVPCALQWLGTVPGEQVIDTPVNSLDLMATFVNAGGAPTAVRNGLDGLDLMPLLKDGVPVPQDRVISLRGSGVTGGGSGLRMGDWKFFNNDPGFNPVLYHLRNDIGETSNVAANHPEIFEEMKERFLAWEARLPVPLYGGGGAELDEGLMRTGITGGYRLRSFSETAKYLSGPFRLEQSMASDWSYDFLFRATEQSHAPNAKLAYGLGSSSNRADLIRAVIDYGSGEIRLEEGLSGASAAVAWAGQSREFQKASLRFDSESGNLIFKVNGATVELPLTGSYGAGLSHFAVGAAAMEGELTTLRPGEVDYSGASLEMEESASDVLGLTLDMSSGDGPFQPAAERSIALEDFQSDQGVLVESLGGGRYQITALLDPLKEREFFRLRFDEP
ncbi:sulfatase-like hydrolase/transferase [Roseibacillus persicicus]|uniref:sulfatase-like hydrolase/transferase n=1 Tax=Roseibacillus persicicus TaxID=454148 RepID=UPI00280D8E81|nr:sulfatase-like hydrolase/transferase [Roseibacillus persicicus]MDQ8190634.1 sulfatase-like hydrolase/transferase [Roseibacillus persicicus]